MTCWLRNNNSLMETNCPLSTLFLGTPTHLTLQLVRGDGLSQPQLRKPTSYYLPMFDMDNTFLRGFSSSGRILV